MRNLKFTLSDIQLGEITETLAKLEAAHRARVAWFDDYSLNGNVLLIHAIDLLSVLSYCQRTHENEMDLYRLRKCAMDQLSDSLKITRNEVKKQNLETWLESYRQLCLGSEHSVDLTNQLHQYGKIELIP
jgi:hypothetical protein